MPIKLAQRITICASSNYGSKLRALSDGGEAVIESRAYSRERRAKGKSPWTLALAVRALFLL